MSGLGQAAGIEADRADFSLGFATCGKMSFAGMKVFGARQTQVTPYEESLLIRQSSSCFHAISPWKQRLPFCSKIFGT